MAAAVAPAALFSLGLSLIDRKLTGNAAEVIWLTALKVIANPILTFALVAYIFVLDPLWAQAAIILSASLSGRTPTSLLSNTMCMSRPSRRLLSCRQVFQ